MLSVSAGNEEIVSCGERNVAQKITKLGVTLFWCRHRGGGRVLRDQRSHRVIGRGSERVNSKLKPVVPRSIGPPLMSAQVEIIRFNSISSNENDFVERKLTFP